MKYFRKEDDVFYCKRMKIDLTFGTPQPVLAEMLVRFALSGRSTGAIVSLSAMGTRVLTRVMACAWRYNQLGQAALHYFASSPTLRETPDQKLQSCGPNS